MRTLKEPEIRRGEILDAAGELFEQKGFDGTSTNDILEKAGIARGTLYYHFKSKEDIIDALVERYTAQLLSAAKAAAEDESAAVLERFARVILSLRLDMPHSGQLMAHMHRPQNALMHQKMQKALVREITPVLADLASQGNEQGLFDTPYPYECMEMALLYGGIAFDDNDVIPLTEEARLSRAEAFLFHLERMLGAQSGSLSVQMVRMFGRGNERGADR